MTRRLTLIAIAPALLAAAWAAPGVSASDYFWKWSDGSRAATRTFAEAHYRNAAALPELIVTSRPADTGATVRLEFLQQGRWELESTGRVGVDGRVRLALNPMCEAGKWCDEHLRYRLKAGGQTAGITIDYRAVAPSSDGTAFAG